MRALIVAVLLSACGSSADRCTAVLSGNLTETVTSDDCASLDDGTLAIDVTGGASFTISIDLGDAVTGTYASATTTSWSVLGNRTTDDGGLCVYAAGSTAVPTGSFTLDLTSLAPHGSVQLVTFVQAQPMTDCGAGDNEMIGVAF